MKENNNRAKIVSLFAAIIAGMLVSCASIKTPKRSDLVPLQAPMAIGNYPVSINRTIKSQSLKDTLIPTNIWHYFKNSEGKDSLNLAKATHIELHLPDETHITATLYSGTNPLKTEKINGRLQNGYFRIKHNFSMKGIPPLYWKTTSSKMQLGVGSEGELYIDSVDETNGMFLFMAAGTPGATRSITVPKYEKQK